jgi:SAM-dependent methyltransferase
LKDYYEDLWRRLPPAATAHDPGRARREQFLREQLRGGERVLDLGCGDGWALPVLAAAGAAEIAGLDVAPAALARARPNADAATAELILGEFDGRFPIPDNRFDLVWAGEVIEHVADTARWLSEVRRVLRPDGRLLLTTPDHPRLALLIRGLDHYAPPLGDHLHLYTRRSLGTLLTEFGFDPVHVRREHGTLLAIAHRP